MEKLNDFSLLKNNPVETLMARASTHTLDTYMVYYIHVMTAACDIFMYQSTCLSVHIHNSTPFEIFWYTSSYSIHCVVLGESHLTEFMM